MTWFEVKDLQRLASAASFQRGEGYLHAVDSVDSLPGGVIATVRGTDDYTVRLSRDGRRLAGECSCPHGAEGAFCKHCVAVGLFLLENGAPPGEEPDLVGYLRSLDQEELVALLIRYAERDPIVHRELALRAASNGSGQKSDAAALACQVDAALTVGSTGSGDMLDYAGKAESILDVLEELRTAGRAGLVAPLARQAVDRIASAVQNQDYLSPALTDVCERALTLAAQACAQSPPDPVELATWLLGHVLSTGHWPKVQLAAFAPALGADGLAAVRQRVKQFRSKHRARTWDEDEDDAAEIPEHKLWRLREELAEIAGDVDAHIAVLSERLPDKHVNRRIAEVLWQANRTDEALHHARRELGQRPTWQTAPLADFLSDAYLQLGCGEEALALRRSQFDAEPDQTTYRDLRDVATRLGQWPQAREDAMRAYRQAAVSAEDVADELVHTLLDESDVDGAWQAVLDYECSSHARVRAARRRGQTHPAEVMPVYHTVVDEYIERKKPGAYRAAAELVRELRDLHARAGTPAEFQRYLGRLREQQRRKTRLLDEVTQALR